MSNYEMLMKFRKKQMDSVVTTLKKVAELVGFINVYGPLYDNYCYGLILNINNISEHYLQNSNSEIIDKLYDVYSNLKKANKSEKNIFEGLRTVLYDLPAFTVTEVSDRRNRHK